MYVTNIACGAQSKKLAQKHLGGSLLHHNIHLLERRFVSRMRLFISGSTRTITTLFVIQSR